MIAQSSTVPFEQFLCDRLMIARRVAELPVNANSGFTYDAYDLGLTRIYDSASLLFAFNANSTSTGPTMLSISLAQG